MEPIQLNVIDAIAARNAAIERSARGAEGKVPGWSERAFQFLLHEYLPQAPDQFMNEDVRQAAQLAGIPEPGDPRAWGAVMIRASKGGHIQPVGYGPTKGVRGHRCPKTIWGRKS